jgi:cytoskeletal protein CcmA (bactofilin family)
MKNDKRPNLKIIGNNSASGGRYNDAKIIGNGTIKGDMDCATFRSVGDSRLEGNLKAGSVKIIGSIHVEGQTEADDVRVTGELGIDGDFRARDCHLRGRITTKSGIKADAMSLTGYVTVKKNCEAESFKADGQIKIDGLLTADDVEIKTYGESRISEIGGDRIVISKGSGSTPGKVIKLLFVPSNWGNAMVTVNTIEGDDIRLSNTRAKVVRGKNVIIESGCEIDLVEYKGNLRVNRSSTVREEKKI